MQEKIANTVKPVAVFSLRQFLAVAFFIGGIVFSATDDAAPALHIYIMYERSSDALWRKDSKELIVTSEATESLPSLEVFAKEIAATRGGILYSIAHTSSRRKRTLMLSVDSQIPGRPGNYAAVFSFVDQGQDEQTRNVEIVDLQKVHSSQFTIPVDATRHFGNGDIVVHLHGLTKYGSFWESINVRRQGKLFHGTSYLIGFADKFKIDIVEYEAGKGRPLNSVLGKTDYNGVIRNAGKQLEFGATFEK